jgi:hypothetical protein
MLGEGSTDGLVIQDSKNNKQFEIVNNNSVVSIGKSGGNTTQININAPIVGKTGSFDATRDLAVGKARFDLGSTTGDGVQIYKTGSSGSALAVLDNSANYLLYAHPTGWVGVGNNTTRTSTEVFKVAGGMALNLGSDATGDIYYRSSGGLLTRLGIGSTGDVLTVASGLPSWTGAQRTIDALILTAQNTGTSETDLFSKTIAANTLTADKQTINFEADGEFNDNTATAQLKLYFAGNVTLNTGAVNISTANTGWRLKGYIIRTSSSTAHVTYELDCPGLATTKFLYYSNLTSLDFTTTNIIKITAQAGGGGGGTGDITAHSWQVLYRPQP